VKVKVLYYNPAATDDVLAIIHNELPDGWHFACARKENTLSHLADSTFILVPDQAITSEHLAAAPNLKMIQHQGVGYERIDLGACRQRRIPVCLTPEGTSIGVAEHTILLILALYKQLVPAAIAVGEGRWPQWEMRPVSFELCGKALGLVGFGRIGNEVARRAHAFGARLFYFDPYVEPINELPVTRTATLNELLRQSDIVSLHAPLTADNHKLINADTLAKMTPGAILINTARGGLVDETALVDALQHGRLAGAALDVLEREPPDPANPLLRMNNVLITPHISAGTRDALSAKMRAAFANMRRRLTGEPLRHIVPELADLFEGSSP
jgi:phosphoglycerate dehydrogenase-like enzyme